MNVSVTHLWSLPMWIMSLASASLLYFRVDLLLIFLGSVGRLFPRIISVHRVECCETW